MPGDVQAASVPSSYFGHLGGGPAGRAARQPVALVGAPARTGRHRRGLAALPHRLSRHENSRAGRLRRPDPADPVESNPICGPWEHSPSMPAAPPSCRVAPGTHLRASLTDLRLGTPDLRRADRGSAALPAVCSRREPAKGTHVGLLYPMAALSSSRCWPLHASARWWYHCRRSALPPGCRLLWHPRTSKSCCPPMYRGNDHRSRLADISAANVPRLRRCLASTPWNWSGSAKRSTSPRLAACGGRGRRS